MRRPTRMLYISRGSGRKPGSRRPQALRTANAVTSAAAAATTQQEPAMSQGNCWVLGCSTPARYAPICSRLCRLPCTPLTAPRLAWSTVSWSWRGVEGGTGAGMRAWQGHAAPGHAARLEGAPCPQQSHQLVGRQVVAPQAKAGQHQPPDKRVHPGSAANGRAPCRCHCGGRPAQQAGQLQPDGRGAGGDQAQPAVQRGEGEGGQDAAEGAQPAGAGHAGGSDAPARVAHEGWRLHQQGRVHVRLSCRAQPRKRGRLLRCAHPCSLPDLTCSPWPPAPPHPRYSASSASGRPSAFR